MSFLTDVRKTALLACITSALSLLWSCWSLLQSLPAIPSRAEPISIALILISAITPIFYFAMYRSEGPLAFPSRLAKLSLIAAIAFGIIIAADLPGWLDSLDLYLTRASAFGWGGDSETASVLVRLVGEASNVAYLLLLIAIYRAPAGESSRSDLLEIVSRIAVVTAGLWLAYNIVSTAAAPYVFWVHREEIQRTGRDPEIVRHMLAGPLRNLLTAACIFAAPYIVSMSQRAIKPDGVPTDPIPSA